jgi:hypothetical protein
MGLLVNAMRTEEKMNETLIREQIEGLLRIPAKVNAVPGSR